MDIKAKISELAEKIKSDKNLGAEFTKNPVKAVEKLLGVDLPDETVEKIVSGVKAKLNVDGAKGALDSLKKLF